MEDLYYEILLAKDGDSIASQKIIQRYNRYIQYMMNRYEITDKNTCYDEVVRNIIKAIRNS